MKQVISNYEFNAIARTVTLPDIETIDLSRLALIVNVTSNVIIFNLADPFKGASVVGNVLTLVYDTSAMGNLDDLRVDYDVPYGGPVDDRVVIGNARSKFRDGFATQGSVPDPAVWDTVNPDAHSLTQGGNSSGAAYLRISMSPFVDNSEITLTSKQSFAMPMRVGFGLSVSQRIVGQEIFAGMVACTPAGDIDFGASQADVPITGATAAILTNVATFTIANHGFNGGDRVSVDFCADDRLNVGPVVVTVVDANNITVPCVLANGSYPTTGGTVRYSDPLRYANNGVGLLFENAVVTNASFVARRNGAKFRSLLSSVASTTAVQSNVNPYTDAFNSAGNQELYLSLDEASYRSFASDGVATMSGLSKYTQGIPDEGPRYKIHIRARTGLGFTLPVAQITAVAKTGTTTATVTTDVPHGLVVGDWVQTYGVRDVAVNFPALAVPTVVASVIDANHFTVILGTAVTASSAGGAVWKNIGSLPAPGVYASSIQSVSRTNNILTLVGNAAWATPLPGEFVEVYGMDGTAGPYNGTYKVLRVNTTSLELASVGANFTSINCGGVVIKRTDIRVNFARVMDYTRIVAEIAGGRGNTTDANNAVPVAITAPSILGASQSTGVATTQWSAAGWGGFLVNDVVSAAIVATTTTTAVSPGSVINVGTYAHSFNVVVTAVTGTTPTYDLSVEESMDNGVNWVRIYDFPRITANGAYTSPRIPAVLGTRYRYVQTLTGVTPSFTRAINRIQFSSATPFIRQFVDRSVVLTTLNSVTPTYNTDGAKDFAIGIKVGAITTTAPQVQLQGTEDETTTGWFNIGAPLTAVANSYVVLNVLDKPTRKVRALVSTAGVGVTADYVTIKATGY